jgi:hypothetical protein
MNLGLRVERPLRIAVLPLLALLTVACESTSTIVGVNDVAADLTITVDEPGPGLPSSNVQTLSLDVGETASLVASARNALGLTIGTVAVQWSSSDYGVASVSVAGVVTAVASGTADIFATSGGVAARLPVVVAAPDVVPPPAP